MRIDYNVNRYMVAPISTISKARSEERSSQGSKKNNEKSKDGQSFKDILEIAMKNNK